METRYKLEPSIGSKKHEIYVAAFGGHLFYDLFVQGLGGAWHPRPPTLDPLLEPVLYVKYLPVNLNVLVEKKLSNSCDTISKWKTRILFSHDTLVLVISLSLLSNGLPRHSILHSCRINLFRSDFKYDFQDALKYT